jgi:hypothetical protein
MAAWSILLSILALAMIGIAFGFWVSPKMNQRSVPKTAGVKDAKPITQFPSPSEAEALAMVKAALLIRDPQQAQEVFRMGRATAQEIVDFLASLSSVESPKPTFEWLSSIDANGLALEGVTVKLGEGGASQRLAVLTPDPAGKWKMDFETLARKCNPPLNEFLTSNYAAVAEVRVYVGSDNYFNGIYSDENEWVCYGLISPDIEQNLYAYCKVGSPQAKAMAAIFLRDSTLYRAVLEIRRWEEGDSRQFEIARVLADDWVLTEKPFDEAYR